MQICRPATLFTLAAALTLTASAQKHSRQLIPAAPTTPIRITADLSEAPRRLFHAEVDIPVRPGPVTLITPKWIPGNHRPTGPVEDITGVVFTVNGPNGVQTLPWRRDDVDLYEFHVTVPAGVTSLHAHLDNIVSSRVSDHMACLEWEKLLLYPADIPVRNIPVIASVTVPAGWGIGTALQPTGTGAPPAYTGIAPEAHTTAGAQTTTYAATTIEQLEDSPVIAGQYFKEFPLAPELPVKHYLDVVSDEPEDSELRPEMLAQVSNLVREANTAYGSHHYNVYHFLLTQSDVAGGEGLEHGQSSDNGVGEKSFADPHNGSDLLAHEYTHSWNGKYRRPARLYQPTFATAEQGDLLWVYEGMTQYMGNVLAARSGLKSMRQYMDTLARTAASLDYTAGRDWRSTEDTAIAASILRSNGPAWSNWRRGQDYYQEGTLFWLDVDTKIRQLTSDKKSITDFQRIFLGRGGNTGPLILGYERPELIADLNQVAPFDWAGFMRDRIDRINLHSDTNGLEQGGYKLVYLDHPAPPEADERGERAGRAAGSVRRPQATAGVADSWYSLGLRAFAGLGGPRGGAAAAGPGATIYDVRFGSPADLAHLSPGETILAVNGHIFSSEALADAIHASKGTQTSIDLLVQHEGIIRTVSLPYHDGDKYPQLQRIEGTPDYLTEIAKPLTTPPPAAQ